MRRAIIFLGLLVMLSSFVSAIDELIYTASATSGYDARIHKGGTSISNYGVNAYLVVGNANPDTGGSARTLINLTEFICNGSIVGNIVSEAVIRWYVDFSTSQENTLSGYPVNQTWYEGTFSEGTGNCSWDYPANDSVAWSGLSSPAQYNGSWNIVTAHDDISVTGGWADIHLNTTYIDDLCNDRLTHDKGIVFIGATSGNHYGGYFSSDHASSWKVLINITEAGGDETPPALLNINCTSCIEDSTPDQEPYETEDTTPTFKLNTSENAWCRIHSSDVNYASMGASRNCTGEGTQGPHTCTLNVPDRFTSPGQNNVYISCIDGSSNENQTGLLMEIKGASETHGDDAIDLGIEISDIWPCTVYNEQQVSARDLADNQFSGIFDRVAVKDNKRWAFNYVSEGESPLTGLFNLTTVLYVLQLQNQTNETITSEVGKLINNTA